MKLKKNKTSISFSLISLFFFIVIPISIVLSIATSLATDAGFYSNLIANSDIISTFLEAQTIKSNHKLGREIELGSNISEIQKHYKEARENYDKIYDEFQNSSKDSEVKALKRSYDDLEDTTWLEMKALYPKESDFNNYKKNELLRLKKQIEKLESGKSDTDQITALKTRLSDAEKELAKRKSEMKEAESKAGDIASRHNSSIMSSLYKDMDLIAPALKKVINEQIKTQFRDQMEMLIHFVTDIDKQKKNGSVKRIPSIKGYNINRTMMVTLPVVTFDLAPRDENGSRKHIFSSTLADMVNNTEGIKNKVLLLTALRSSDGKLMELITAKYLEKTGVSLENNRIIIRQKFTGETAERLVLVMQVLSHKNIIIFAPAGLAVIYFFLLLLARGDWSAKFQKMSRILTYPSAAILLSIYGVWIFLTFFSNTLSTVLTEETMRLYTVSLGKEVLWISGFRSVFIFLPMVIIGLIMGRASSPRGKTSIIRNTPR